jgi:ParB family transcriptional regulator, chromosome partitioning protein
MRIEDIDFGANHRSVYSEEAISRLAENIAEKGVIQPVVVTPEGVLIAGMRRVLAAKEAGLSEIPVVYRSPKSDRDSFEVQVSENLQREDLTPVDLLAGVYAARAEHGMKNVEIARVFGLYESQVSAYCTAFERLLPQTREYIQEHCPNKYSVTSIVELTKMEPADVHALITNGNVPETVAQVKELAAEATGKQKKAAAKKAAEEVGEDFSSAAGSEEVMARAKASAVLQHLNSLNEILPDFILPEDMLALADAVSSKLIDAINRSR